MVSKVRRLSSGWLRIEVHGEGFAQVPPGFSGDEIPDEYIFNPEWHRDAVNAAWRAAVERSREE